MPLYVADYLSDAAHLSTLEHGAYLLLIMTYWQRGESLPADDKKLARICRIGPREWAKIKPTISEFFEVTCDIWLHKRVERELRNVRDKSLKKRAGGLARAKQMHGSCSAGAQQTDTDTETDKIEPNGSCASPDAPGLKPEHVVEEWNTLAGRLGKPKVRDLTPERRQLLKARIAQYELDDFLNVFGKIERSPFLRGDTGWQRCSFDWIFKKANFQKALEGNYDQ